MKSQEKFYRGNQDIFQRYFESPQQYEAIINAGNFAKLENIIKENTIFDADKYIESLIKEKEENSGNA